MVTNDGATILRELDVQHPAAKLLVEISQTQDQEGFSGSWRVETDEPVGDGTTSVVVIAGELLSNCRRLLDNQVHPTAIISAFLKASHDALLVTEELCIPFSDNSEALEITARTAIATKLTGQWSPVMAKLAVNAVTRVHSMETVATFSEQLRIVEMPGAAVDESMLVHGAIVPELCCESTDVEGAW